MQTEILYWKLNDISYKNILQKEIQIKIHTFVDLFTKE